MAELTQEQKRAAMTLSQVADAAYKLFPNDCSHAVNYVISQLVNNNQKYEVANALIGSLSSSNSGWKVVNVSEVSDLANRGRVVVGGLSKNGGNGHVIIVLPGPLKESGGFAYKGHLIKSSGRYSPAMSGSMGSYPGAKSDGEKTIRDPWSTADWHFVTFWTPIK